MFFLASLPALAAPVESHFKAVDKSLSQLLDEGWKPLDYGEKASTILLERQTKYIYCTTQQTKSKDKSDQLTSECFEMN